MQLLEERHITINERSLAVKIFSKRKKHCSAIMKDDGLHIYLSHRLPKRDYEDTITELLEWGKRQQPKKTTSLWMQMIADQSLTTWTGETYSLRWIWTTAKRIEFTIQENKGVIGIPTKAQYLNPHHPEYPDVSLLTDSDHAAIIHLLNHTFALKYHKEITALVQKYAKKMTPEKKLGTVSFQLLKSRWGSCDHRGNITLNSQLLFLPQKFIEYVIVHEVAHLEFPHHKSTFWALVASKIPHWKALRDALNQRQ